MVQYALPMAFKDTEGIVCTADKGKGPGRTVSLKRKIDFQSKRFKNYNPDVIVGAIKVISNQVPISLKTDFMQIFVWDFFKQLT